MSFAPARLCFSLLPATAAPACFRANRSCWLAALAAVLTLAAVPGTARAQAGEGRITGTVRAEESGELLPGASVRIVGRDQGTATGSNGRFTLDDVPAGSYTVEAQFVGYRATRQEVAVRPGQTAQVAFILAAGSVALDDVVVTSQKRVQRVQEVPAAITAYDGAFIEDLGLNEMDALADYVPGLQVQLQSPNNPGFVVRGITSDSGDSRIEPRVSIFQDGVSISKSRGSVVELYDLERVEVLKGPQGTLFGRGAQIGALHLIQNKAQNTYSARVDAGIGNYAERYATGHVNVPVVEDQFFGRVAAFYNGRDGFLENRTGDALNGKETFAVRGSVRWLPTSSTVVDAIVNYQRDTPPGISFKSAAYAPENSTPSPNDPAALGPDPVLENDELFVDRTVWGATLLVDQMLSPAWTLNSITAYRTFDSLERFDADGTPAPVLQFDEDAQGQQFSQELRATFENDGPLSGFGGASFFWEDGSQRVPWRTDEGALLALVTPDQALFDANGNVNRIPALPDGNGNFIPLKEAHEEAFENFGSTSALEAFVDGTYDVTERLSLTAGLRGTYEDVTSAYEVYDSETPGTLGSILGGAPNNLFAPTNGRPERSETFLSAVGRFAAKFELAEESNVFASVSRGRRPNVINVDAGGSEVLDNEIVWSYEAGVKGRVLANRLEYEANGFYYDYTNFQTSVFELQGDELVTETRDSGAATALGFETALRAALARGITAFGTYSFIDATFDDEDTDGVGQDLAGNRFRLTPRHTFSLGANASVPVAEGTSLFVRPNVTFKSDFFFTEENETFEEVEGNTNPPLRQGDYALLNVRGGVNFMGGRLGVEGFVENVLDEEYIIDAGNTGNGFGIPTYIAGPPRFYGVRLTARL